MKTKSILSMLALLTFVLIGGGSFDETDLWLFGSLIVLSIIIVVIVIIISEKQTKRDIARKEEIQSREKAELEIKRSNYENQKEEFISKNGIPDKSISVKQYEFNSEILVYESQRKVFLEGRECRFEDILSCKFTDSPQTKKGTISAVTKNDNKNVVGRAIIGDVVAGPVGAIIGGTTSKKETQITQTNDVTTHNYTVIININSIASPIIRINTGENGRLTNEIVGLMNVIISRRKW